MPRHYNVLFFVHRRFGSIDSAEAILNFKGAPSSQRIAPGRLFSRATLGNCRISVMMICFVFLHLSKLRT
jgi:hypothetical protein